MRLGVIADVHGNEVALRAVLDDAAGCVIVIVGGLIYFPMLILGPIGERIVG